MPRADYGSSHPVGAISAGGLILTVQPDSPADRAGLVAGDAVVSASGQALRDVLDWQWESDGPSVALTVRDPDGHDRAVDLVREPGESWGIDFADALFDGIRTCRNNCAFCFMTQLPKGLRPALYVRDDDYRLSFLQGNFVTLTNVDDEDIARIARQRLSPLYVSLHAVDPDVRAQLVCAQHDRTLERIDQLLAEEIVVHVQVVLVPDVNDGDVLERTLTWLAEREGIASVGIVPLGYTRFQDTFSRSFAEPLAAAHVIQQVQRWQFACMERDGVSWVHLADEFYLNARAPMPTAEWYDAFPQYENGIGIVRTFVDEAADHLDRLKSAVAALPADSDAVTVVTGVMAATTLAGALNAAEGAGRVRLLVVPNRFFGGNVSVTGLLAGRDISDAIKRDAFDGTYFVPDILLNADGLTLDGFALEELCRDSGAELRLVSSDAAGLLAAIEQSAGELADNARG